MINVGSYVFHKIICNKYSDFKTFSAIFYVFTIIPRSLFELNFLNAKPAKGFYKLTVNVSPKKADARLIGTSGAEVRRNVFSLGLTFFFLFTLFMF